MIEQYVMAGMWLETYTHRYEERDDKYEIRTYREAVETVGHGNIGEQPAWLKRIVDIAYLGDYIVPVPAPPPDLVMWFLTDRDLNLIEFKQLKDNR